jgi:hypothetical protein
MAQRRSKPAPQNNTPDYLAKSKELFEDELSERIKIGEELLNKVIQNQADFSPLIDEHDHWHDYNSELISRAFNNPQSQYHYDYSRMLPMNLKGLSLYYEPTFNERVADYKDGIREHVDRLKKIKAKLNLIDEQPALQIAQSPQTVSKQDRGLKLLSNLFSKFHKVAQHLRYRHGDRDTLVIKDEYDVQDLLGSLLRIDFEDIRSEDYVPSYAGGNSRVDFTLKEEKIIVEVKMTNDYLKDKDIGSQLLIDIGRYHNHPDCEILAVFIYDRLDNIRNKPGLISDLENRSTPQLKVRVFIEPK